jgi:hypothetical protein
MKKVWLVLTLSLASTIAYSQYKIPLSVTEDRDLSKYIFDYVNQYRATIQEKPYIWTDFWYNSAKKWNDYTAYNGKWGHNRGPGWENWHGVELIVAVPIINSSDNNYKFIADSALQQWLHSPYHKSGIECPLMEKLGDRSPQQFGSASLSNVFLTKYGAISANILDYGTYKQIRIIFQTGFYPNSAEMIPSALW